MIGHRKLRLHLLLPGAMTGNRRRGLIFLFGVALIGWSPKSHAGAGFTVESVSDFSYSQGSAFNTDANQEACGLLYGPTAWTSSPAGQQITGTCNSAAHGGVASPSSGYTLSAWYQDYHVWSTDFKDPALTGNPADSDYYFDHSANLLSTVITHGQCNDSNAAYCTTDANCPAGSFCPGGPTPPSGYSKTCLAEQTHEIDMSSGSSPAQLVTYGKAWGGTPVASMSFGGPYGGATTGTNVALIVNSCGFRARSYVYDSSYFFGGIHSLLFAVPTYALAPSFFIGTPPVSYSDTAQDPTRGYTIAATIMANPLNTVASAWLNPTLVNNGFTFSASGFPSNVATGANFILSEDRNSTWSSWHVNTESWFGAAADSNDATSQASWTSRWQCNYNCNTYGL